MISAAAIMDLLCAVRPAGCDAKDYPALCEYIAAGLNLREEPPAPEAPAPVALPPRGPGGRFVRSA